MDLKSISLLSDSRHMRHAPARLVARYRIILQRDGEGFAASIAELPTVRTCAAGVDEAVNVARATAAVVVAPMYTQGRAPAPLCDSQGPLGAWAQDLELIDADTESAGSEDLEKPARKTLRSIAEATADEYRIILEEPKPGASWTGVCAELPEVVVQGRTPEAVVKKLRRGMVGGICKLLDANRMPPEAMRDVEARRGVRPQPRVVAKAA
jgi:predicted RNase H-like HicB family nuclease